MGIGGGMADQQTWASGTLSQTAFERFQTRLKAADGLAKKLHEQWDSIDQDLIGSHWQETKNPLTLQTVHLAWIDFVIVHNAVLSRQPRFYVVPEEDTTLDMIGAQEYVANY